MNYNQFRFISISVLLFLLLISTGCEESTSPSNHDPAVTSIVAFPNQVQEADSFAVICSAYDQDGDSLFYDWSCTNHAASIKGAPPENPFQLLNSKDNIMIFYATDSLLYQNGHAAIFCDVRDRNEGLKTVTIFVAIHK